MRTEVTHQKFEEADHTQDGEEMRSTSHDGAKPCAARFKHRAQEERDEEQRNENGGVEDDRTERDDSDAHESARPELARRLVGERLDKHVGHSEDRRDNNWQDDLGEQDGPPSSTRDVAGQLL